MNIYKVDIKDKSYYVVKSTRKNKKYDVYVDDGFLLSFGDNRYEHYYDKFGDYSTLDHNDDIRRSNYLKRSAPLGNDVNSSNFWSRSFLW